MNRRRNDRPKPEIPNDRRQAFRREDDVETHTIAENAVGTVSIVRKLVETGKVAAAVGACCTLIGGATGALGYKIIGPKQQSSDEIAAVRVQADTNSARIGRILGALEESNRALAATNATLVSVINVQCIQLQLDHPQLQSLCPKK